MKHAFRAAVAVFSALLFAGCAFHSVHVADLQYRPDRYYHRDVTVTGVVTSSFGVPLVPFQMYKVDDGTGEIAVLSRGSRAPRRGTRVRVSGRLDDVGTFGGNSIGLHIEERSRKYRY